MDDEGSWATLNSTDGSLMSHEVLARILCASLFANGKQNHCTYILVLPLPRCPSETPPHDPLGVNVPDSSDDEAAAAAVAYLHDNTASQRGSVWLRVRVLLSWVFSTDFVPVVPLRLMVAVPRVDLARDILYGVPILHSAPVPADDPNVSTTDERARLARLARTGTRASLGSTG